MIIQESMTLKRKLEILSDAAKYDVAHPVVWIEREMERAWETALLLESVIVLLRMADVSVF